VNDHDPSEASAQPDQDLHTSYEPGQTVGWGRRNPARRGSVQYRRQGQIVSAEEDRKRARREVTILWLFLAAVLVISFLTAWLFLAKIRSH